MHRIRLVIAGLAAATTVAALTATPTQAVTTSTTGVAKVFMVNPVQSSGNQDLTRPEGLRHRGPGVGVRHRGPAQPRRLGYLSGA